MSAIVDQLPSNDNKSNMISELFINVNNTSSTCPSSASQSQSTQSQPLRQTMNESNQSLILFRKDCFVNPTAEEINELTIHLENRLIAENGETLYCVGASENGESGLSEDDLNSSIANLCKLSAKIESDFILLRRRKGDSGFGCVAEYLIRKRAKENDFQEVRVAVVGNVDAGKSTLLGVLTHGELDNGRGLARQRLFRHKHEMESGRTSSVGNDILGFDSKGNVVNTIEHGGHLDWVKICEASSKVITFIDLAGHERYLKTTIFGMTGHAPDYTMLMIGANAGVVGMTKEHLGLALALNVPVFVVITKIDMCPTNVLQNTLRLVQRVLKSPGCRKIPVMVQSEDDVVIAATNFATERLCPIFQVSNVNGTNLDLLRVFLNILMPRSPNHDKEAAEFQIDDTYSVPGVGTVVSGLTLKGIVRLNDVLYLGPDSLGHFLPIAIKSIHRKRMPVKEVRSGQTASFALKKMKRSDIRKGMVMLSPTLNPQAYWEFEGEILVLHHPTTISPRYQAMVHCGSIRQTASILSMSSECLRTGDKATVHFRFIKNPEYLHVGTRMVFREGRTKAIGNISKLLTGVPPNIIHKTKTKKMLRQSIQTFGAQQLGPNENVDSNSTTIDSESSSKTTNKRTRGRHRGGNRHNKNYTTGETSEISAQNSSQNVM